MGWVALGPFAVGLGWVKNMDPCPSLVTATTRTPSMCCVCSVSPGLRTITYIYGMQEQGNEQVWDKVWNLYLNASEPAEKIKLLKALTQTRLVWLIHR